MKDIHGVCLFSGLNHVADQPSLLCRVSVERLDLLEPLVSLELL